MCNRYRKARVILVAILLATAWPARGSGEFAVSWYTIDGGGGTSTGGGIELSGTIGQPDASGPESLTGGQYTLTGGFWAVAMPACTTFVAPDFDQDCDVDGDDLAVLAACATGSAVPYDPGNLPPGCELSPDAEGFIAADFDKDGDVDADDFGVFQRCYSGPGMSPDPACLGEFVTQSRGQAMKQ